MTFSILVRDAETGRFGGAATTGSLCVGGWVLRGDPVAGLSASQGAAPSTFWGEEVLARMRGGADARTAVEAVTGADPGRERRQLSALDAAGTGHVFTGTGNTEARGGCVRPDLVVAGNLLSAESVIDATADAFEASEGPLPDRLLGALRAGEAAGSDSRGLLSAALLVVGPDIPPLTLRIDWSDAPLDDLAALLERTRDPDYAAWLGTVPVLDDPARA